MPWAPAAREDTTANRWLDDGTEGGGGGGDGQAYWYDGTTLHETQSVLWWNGSQAEPASIIGWWDGTTVQPVGG